MTVLTGDTRYVEYLREIPESERGEITMCEVMDRAEQRGIKLGEERGIKLGEERGIDSARVESIRNLMKNASWTAEKAMESMEIDKTYFEKYKSML